MFKSRLTELRKEKGCNMKQTASMLNIPYTTYVGYEKGEREPDSEKLILLSDFFDCSVDYLICRSEKRYISEPDKKQQSDPSIDTYANPMRDVFSEREDTRFLTKYNALDLHGKNVVNTILALEYDRCVCMPQPEEEPETPTWSICYNEYKVSAGTGVMLDEYERLDRIDVIDTPEVRRADYGLMISGDSMEPVYHDGDIVLVRQTNNIDAGEIGIFVMNGDGYIKKFGGDRLISLNPDYGDILLHEYDSIRCCGLVIGVAELPGEI